VSILVIDIGTSGVRAALVDPDSRLRRLAHRPLAGASPAAGLVEIDAQALAATTLEVAHEAMDGETVEAVGVTNQRATTIVWDRVTGAPVGPGIGWQDLRTVGICLALQDRGLRLAPNASATKLAHLLDGAGRDDRHLAFGTVDTWVAWTLTSGSEHVIDVTNAAATGMASADGYGWDQDILDALQIPPSTLPRIVDSTGAIGACTALPGAPPLTGLVGDQQASLLGQSCLAPGQTKATFGTGAMLDCVTGPLTGPSAMLSNGCYPLPARSRDGKISWAVEGIVLTAGSCVDWLRDDLELIASAAESEIVAGRCLDTEGVWFVPALLGLGTPAWDYGARGTLLGLTRGSGRPKLVRAVLEGVAHRGADLLEAAEADTGLLVPVLRIDGGMSANGVFVQALADACGRPVEVSPVREATTLGAAYVAGLAVGVWAGDDDVIAAWSPSRVVEPIGTADRDRWREAVSRAGQWLPELSGLRF